MTADDPRREAPEPRSPITMRDRITDTAKAIAARLRPRPKGRHRASSLRQRRNTA